MRSLVKFVKGLFCFAIISLNVSNIGYGTFVIENNVIKSDVKENSSNEVACCYNGNIKYTSIEKALEKSESGTIYVIPGTNPTIKRSCTIKPNVTLCLPYEGETYFESNNGVNSSNPNFSRYHNTFSDNDEAKYLKSKVTIKSTSTNKVTLVNNGRLLIGGILGLGSNNQQPTGHTCNMYSEIELSTHSTIINNGYIECRGYIKRSDKLDKTAKLINRQNSTVLMPLVIYDYRGGSYSAACATNSTFPFAVFDLPNINLLSEYEYGSTLNVLVRAFANNRIYEADPCKLLSNTGGLFNMKSGKIVIEYASSTFPKTSNDCKTTTKEEGINRTNVLIDGTVNLDSMVIGLAGNTIETYKFMLPFSYKFNIEISSNSIVTIPNKVKFLSGSKLTLHKGSKVTINENVLAYQTYNNANDLINVYPSSLGKAKLINNGELTINKGFGGFIDTKVENSKVITGASFVDEVTSREVLRAQRTKNKYKDITVYASSTIGSDLTKARLVSNSTYLSKRINQSFYYDGMKGNTNIDEVSGPIQDGCFAKGTKVLMSDGTYKLIENIKIGDPIMIWNHDKGVLEKGMCAYVFKNEEVAQPVMKLRFSNLKELEVMYGHSFFNLEERKYIELRKYNVSDYIGKHFYHYDYQNKVGEYVTLDSVSYYNKVSPAYALVSAYHMNTISDGFVNITDDISGLYNYFECDENLKFDPVQKASDIKKYGLYEYEEWKDYFTKEEFDLFAVKYLKVSVGKGLLTEDTIKEYVDRYFR